ncbi:four-carbon acid sugar kinase family protein [Primorskyibacter sp. S187A]|uniref:four-carbon acid sugar kinase family protein n=1 Tax=Primorskyibacter sp. S187A TaxID=3415130 RepID=UPI003C7D4C01
MFIISDDLAGAFDCAGHFSSLGIPTDVYLSSSSLRDGKRKSQLTECVKIVDLDCRYCSHEQLERTLNQVSNECGKPDFVKIDSTLRGNSAKIVDYVSDRFGRSIVCVATPWHGRTVEGGQVFVNGSHLLESEFSVDSLGDKFSNPNSNLRYLNQNHNFLDGVIEKDLEEIYDRHRGKEMLIGASGLCKQLIREHKGSVGCSGYKAKPNSLLIVSGSRSKLSNSQIAYASQSNKVLDSFVFEQVLEFPDTFFEAAKKFIKEHTGQNKPTIFFIGGSTQRVFFSKLNEAKIEMLGTLPPALPIGKLALDGHIHEFISKGGNSGNAYTIRDIL